MKPKLKFRHIIASRLQYFDQLHHSNVKLSERLNQQAEKIHMAGTRKAVINRGIYSQRINGRLIPKSGQVKLAIVLGLAHSCASIFSRSSSRCVGALFSMKRDQNRLGKPNFLYDKHGHLRPCGNIWTDFHFFWFFWCRRVHYIVFVQRNVWF